MIFALSFVCMGFCATIILILAGQHYVGYAAVVRITTFTGAIISSIWLPCQMVIVSARMTRQFAGNYLVATVLNVAPLLCLAPHLACTMHEGIDFGVHGTEYRDAEA